MAYGLGAGKTHTIHHNDGMTDERRPRVERRGGKIAWLSVKVGALISGALAVLVYFIRNNTVLVIMLPGLFVSAVMWVSLWAISRKRRWDDFGKLGRAVSLPPELRRNEPERVRDVAVGQSALVWASDIGTSKQGRVYVRWDARLQHGPADPSSLKGLAKIPSSDWSGGSRSLSGRIASFK